MLVGPKFCGLFEQGRRSQSDGASEELLLEEGVEEGFEECGDVFIRGVVFRIDALSFSLQLQHGGEDA